MPSRTLSSLYVRLFAPNLPYNSFSRHICLWIKEKIASSRPTHSKIRETHHKLNINEHLSISSRRTPSVILPPRHTNPHITPHQNGRGKVQLFFLRQTRNSPICQSHRSLRVMFIWSWIVVVIVGSILLWTYKIPIGLYSPFSCRPYKEALPFQTTTHDDI